MTSDSVEILGIKEEGLRCVIKWWLNCSRRFSWIQEVMEAKI